MKKILIVEKELKGFERNPRIVIKKHKTIIKDRNYFTKEFLNSLDAPYKYLLETWEVFNPGNKKNQEKISLVCALDGSRLKTVHTITHQRPLNGSKALFQVEKAIVIKISNGMFDATKYTVDAETGANTETIKIGKYKNFEDIKNQLPENLKEVIDNFMLNYNDFKENGYKHPFYAIVGD